MGANAGIGISLGDNCTVEAGLYITSGTKIHIIESDDKEINVLKLKKFQVIQIFYFIEILFLEKLLQKGIIKLQS